MSTLIMMIGLPASGKSSYAKKFENLNNFKIHSSDTVREELGADVKNQKMNKTVFKTLHKRVIEDLKQGNNVIFDATNIHSNKRIKFLEKLSDIDCYKTALVMISNYQSCLDVNNTRERQVPEYIIKRMCLQFEFPTYDEGWDEINFKKCEKE